MLNVWGQVCSDAGNVSLKDKAKTQTKHRKQSSHLIRQVKKWGFEYCRKSPETHSQVSKEPEESEVVVVPASLGALHDLRQFAGMLHPKWSSA